MSTLSNILEQVLLKALPQVEKYSKLKVSQWNSSMWRDLEEEIGRIYHGFLSSLLFDRHLERQAAELSYMVDNEGAFPFGEKVTLGAINQRGLFRKNGRATILEPCTSFSPRVTEVDKHNALHHIYMHLVQKADSINQLFLSTTNLDSLAVIFCEKDKPTIEVSDDKRLATIHVPEELADLLAPPDYRKRWKETINFILVEYNLLEIYDEDNQIRRQFENEIKLRLAEFDEPDKIDSLYLLREWPEFFKQWLSIIPNKELSNIEQAGILFESWLWSIAWLMFYCQEEVAGRFFYTVRLPSIIDGPNSALPESSLSLVTRESLLGEHLNNFISICKTFRDDSGKFKQIRLLSEKSLKNFRNQRIKNTPVLEGEDKKHPDILEVLKKLYSENSENNLPVGSRRLCFLLNLARSLVGRRHEGVPLRFCFIYGFGYDRVNQESKGVLEEFQAPLRHRWSTFWNKAKLAYSQASEKHIIGRCLSEWIKSNDLQLQRPDVALYFEEDVDNSYPVPVSLVQIRRMATKEVHPVSTELELRQALRELSLYSDRTIAVVTGSSGLFVFIQGKCLLIRCSGKEDWDEKFHLYKTDNSHEVLEIQIESDLKEIFRNKFDDRADVAERTAEIVRHLCEALVTMGHGGMFLVRPRENTDSTLRLPPLNPVWLLRSKMKNLKEVKKDCAIFALMAALDGATELTLPSEEDEPIYFYSRRFAALTDPQNWVWEDDEDEPGDVDLAAGFENKMWRLLIGKGTRHHSALVLSRSQEDALVITVSADGPVTIYEAGKVIENDPKIRFAP